MPRSTPLLIFRGLGRNFGLGDPDGHAERIYAFCGNISSPTDRASPTIPHPYKVEKSKLYQNFVRIGHLTNVWWDANNIRHLHSKKSKTIYVRPSPPRSACAYQQTMTKLDPLQVWRCCTSLSCFSQAFGQVRTTRNRLIRDELAPLLHHEIFRCTSRRRGAKKEKRPFPYRNYLSSHVRHDIGLVAMKGSFISIASDFGTRGMLCISTNRIVSKI